MYCVVFNCNVPLSPYTGSSSDWPDSHWQVWDREGLLPGAWGVLGAVLWLHRHLEAAQQSGGGVHDWDECPRGRHHRQTCFSRPLWWYQMGGSTIFSIISLNLSWFLSRENLLKKFMIFGSVVKLLNTGSYYTYFMFLLHLLWKSYQIACLWL